MDAIALRDWILAPVALVQNWLHEPLVDALRPGTPAGTASLLDHAAEQIHKAGSTIGPLLSAMDSED